MSALLIYRKFSLAPLNQFRIPIKPKTQVKRRRDKPERKSKREKLGGYRVSDIEREREIERKSL